MLLMVWSPSCGTGPASAAGVIVAATYAPFTLLSFTPCWPAASSGSTIVIVFIRFFFTPSYSFFITIIITCFILFLSCLFPLSLSFLQLFLFLGSCIQHARQRGAC